MLSSPQSFPHVAIRGKIYYYQRRVPSSVRSRPDAFLLHFSGQALYRKSLETSVYSEALARAALAEAKFDRAVAVAIGASVAVRPSLSPRALDPAGLADIARSIRDKLVDDWRHDIVAAETSPEMADYLEWRLDKVIAVAAREGDIGLVLGGSSVDERAKEINVSENFRVDTKSLHFGELKRAIRDGLTEARRDIQSMFEGNSLPSNSNSTLINSFSSCVAPQPSSPTVSVVALEQFRVSNYAPKTVVKYRRAHERFIEVVGDKSINQVVRDDINAFLEAVTARNVGDGAGAARPISQATVQSYLVAISSLLAVAISKGWRAGPNPAAGINLAHWVAEADVRSVPLKRRFKEVEINALLLHPWFSGCESSGVSYKPGHVLLDDMRYWASILALYTGARASELGGLKISEIALGVAPHITLQPNEYRRIKSGKPRVVPVLDALLELGFADYVGRVASRGSDRLFPDWECPRDRSAKAADELSRWANSKWLRAFNRTVIPAVLPRADHELRSAVTFHSFRGAFKKLLDDHQAGKKANWIMGHSQDALDQAYIADYTPEELHEAFRDARYRTIAIPVGRLLASHSGVKVAAS